MTQGLKILKRPQASVNNLRKKGLLPGVIYGPILPEKSLSVCATIKDFFQFYKNYESGLFDVLLDDHIFQGLIKEVQIDPLTNQVLHFDIYLPPLDKKIKTKVILEFKGSSPAVKKGGVLDFNIHEVEVVAFANSVPEYIAVDISVLEDIGQSIRVKDLTLPEGVKILLEENFPVVTVIEEAGGQQINSSLTKENNV